MPMMVSGIFGKRQARRQRALIGRAETRLSSQTSGSGASERKDPPGANTTGQALHSRSGYMYRYGTWQTLMWRTSTGLHFQHEP